jgi:hypothetical protein
MAGTAIHDFTLPKPAAGPLAPPNQPVMAGTAIHDFTIRKPRRRPNPRTTLKPARVAESICGSVYGLFAVTFQNVNRGREMWTCLGFPDRVLPYTICPIMECFRGKWQLILVAYKY